MPSNTKSTRSLGAGSSGRTHHLAAGLCCSASRCHASSGSRSRRRRDRGHSARRRPSDRCAHIPGRPQGGAQQPLSDSLVHDLPKPSPPARSSPPTTASATTRSTAAAASPCATTAGLVLSLKLTLTGRPQCRSHAMPSLSQSLSVLASYSELLTSNLVTGLLPLLVLSSAPGRATRPPDPGSRLCGTARRGLAATRPGRFRR
jgi:hypothetical protein